VNWFYKDFKVTSDILLCGFSGALGRKIDKIEWNQFFNSIHLNSKKLYLRDLNNSWWQCGFSGLKGYGVEALLKFLEVSIKESEAKKVIFLGTSMGGYGALLFGNLLKVDYVVAIVEQSYISEDRIEKFNLSNLYRQCNIDFRTMDLKNFITGTRPECHLYFGDVPEDIEAAERLSNFKNIILHPCTQPTHKLAKDLVKDGTIEKLLVDLVSRD